MFYFDNYNAIYYTSFIYCMCTHNYAPKTIMHLNLNFNNYNLINNFSPLQHTYLHFYLDLWHSIALVSHLSNLLPSQIQIKCHKWKTYIVKENQKKWALKMLMWYLGQGHMSLLMYQGVFNAVALGDAT
jgi:hypothetical protein